LGLLEFLHVLGKYGGYPEIVIKNTESGELLKNGIARNAAITVLIEHFKETLVFSRGYVIDSLNQSAILFLWSHWLRDKK